MLVNRERIANLYGLVRTELDGTETLLKVHWSEESAIKDKQEREWSCIQNTGTNRTDLSIITFERKE